MRRSNLLFLCALLCVFFLTVPALAAANARSWQKGTLVDTEQSKVLESTTKHKTTDGSSKQNGNKSNYSQDSTTTTTDNYDTYQTYTIDSGQKRYVAREHLLFPWSKPASATVGEPVKFAIEKNKLYIMGDDGKEHKTSIVKTSMKAAE